MAPQSHRRQHLVSRVVLSRFETTHLEVYDLVEGTCRESTGRAEGFVKDFIKVGARTSEERWQQVEGRLPAAIDAVESGEFRHDTDAQQVLKDVLALHWARSHMLRDAHQNIIPAVIRRRSPALLDRREELDAAFRDRYGLHPAGREAREIIADEIYETSQARLDRQGFFRDRVHANFDEAQRRLADLGVQVGIAMEGDFLIGDSPALTVRRDTDAVGPLQGVPWSNADALVLPIGPRHMLAAGGETRTVDLPRHHVDRLNRAQISAAVRNVYYAPNSRLRGFIETEMAPGGDAS